MDFEFYRNFLAVAEEGNLTAAAQRLSLAQPALSAQIRTLEKYYGVQLMKKGRGQRRLELTEAGSDFLVKARQICQTEESLVLDMQSFGQMATGTLRFSVSHVAAKKFLERCLLPFVKKYPKINYQFREETATEQTISLKNGTSDFAYANAPVAKTNDFEYRVLERERFIAVWLHGTDYFSGKKPLMLSDFIGVPISCNFGCFALLRKLFQNYGIVPDVRFIATTGLTAAEFVKSGCAVAIVSEDCGELLNDDFEKRLVDEPELSFEQTLYWRKEASRSPAAQIFLKYMTD